MQNQTWDTNNFVKEQFFRFLPIQDLTLPAVRLYKTPEGNVYPSVTSQLSALGKDGIARWRKRVGEEEADKIMIRAAKRGTRVHKLLEAYIDGNDPYYLKDAMPPDVEMFKMIRKVIDEHVTSVFDSEFPLYSHTLKTAGRCDLLARYDGEPAVIDFKSSRKEKMEEYILNYKYQATAYAIMITELSGYPIEKFHIIIASDESFHAQVFSGNVSDYRESVVDFFQEQYNIQAYDQPSLQNIFERGL